MMTNRDRLVEGEFIDFAMKNVNSRTNRAKKPLSTFFKEILKSEQETNRELQENMFVSFNDGIQKLDSIDTNIKTI